MKVTIKRDHVVPIGLASLLTLMLLASIAIAPTSETGSTTLNASVNVYVDISSSTQLDEGIFFGDVDPGSIGNPAQNNSNCDGGTCYNLTVDAASNVNLDFYNNLTASLGSGLYVNESSSTTAADSGFSSNTTVDETAWSIMGNATINCTDVASAENCWTMYYLDVDSGTTGGVKSTTYTYCAVEKDQGSEDCT